MENAVFVKRQTTEKSTECNKPSYMYSIDLEKATLESIDIIQLFNYIKDALQLHHNNRKNTESSTW